MQPTGNAPCGSLWAGVAVIVGVVLLSALLPSGRVHYRSTGATPEAAQEWKGLPHHGPVYSILLPYEEPNVPAGPNQEQFKALCRLCHSPRLALTQPRFSEKKWAEIVHKMVAVYGAQIPPEQERAVVVYLNAIRGPEH